MMPNSARVLVLASPINRLLVRHSRRPPHFGSRAATVRQLPMKDDVEDGAQTGLLCAERSSFNNVPWNRICKRRVLRVTRDKCDGTGRTASIGCKYWICAKINQWRDRERADYPRRVAKGGLRCAAPTRLDLSKLV
jgi:hypothetical protein